MDVRLSPEQRALRDAVAQLGDRLGPDSVSSLLDAGRRDRLAATLAATGWRELRDPDDEGRPATSTVEVALVAEELARSLVDVPFLGPLLAAELRRLAGLPPAGAAETVLLTADLGALGSAVAVDVTASRTALLLDGSGLLLASLADDDLDPVDLTRATASRVLTTTPLGGELDDDGLIRWTTFGLALTCAELVGVMRAAVELACGHALARRQFGAAIGSFQAVQHLLADAHVAMEASRSVALHAAWAVDSLPPAEALVAASVAKAWCARASRQVCETSIQVHGGIGNTWECLAHVHLRRALQAADVLGGAGPSLERVLVGHGVAAA